MDLPKLKELKGEKNLQEWKKLLLLHLSYHDLEKYILEAVVATPANKKDRIKVLLFIQSSLSTDVQERLMNGGSKADEMDPKVLYEDILRIVPAASENAIAELMEEFCQIKRNKFTTFHKFLERVQYLRRRLKELIPTLSDEVCVWIALAGIKEYQFYTHLMVQQKEGKLTWETFTREMLVEANREGANTTLLAQPRTGGAKNKDLEDDQEKAARLDAKYGPRKYHEYCGYTHRGGDDQCWKVHPEFKPKSTKWPKNKNKEDMQAPRPSANSTEFQSGLHGMMVHMVSPQTSPYQIQKDTLILDSGASSHTFNDATWFDKLEELPQAEVFGSANGGKVVTKHRGVVRFSVTTSTGKTTNFKIGAVYSPSAPCNLLSTGKFKEDNAIMDGWRDLLVHKTTKQELASYNWINNVAVLKDVHRQKNEGHHLAQLQLASVSFDVMHQRLGHANKTAVLKAAAEAGIGFTHKEVESHHCEACLLAKAQDVIPRETVKAALRPIGPRIPLHQEDTRPLYCVRRQGQYDPGPWPDWLRRRRFRWLSTYSILNRRACDLTGKGTSLLENQAPDCHDDLVHRGRIHQPYACRN